MKLSNQFFFNPWENELLSNISKTEISVILVCPFLKTPIIKKIFSILPDNKNLSLDVITRFSKSVFIQNSSDFLAIDLLLNFKIPNVKISVYEKKDLHAKIYLIDNNLMYLTSSNLSYSGLNKNYEVAVKISNQKDIKKIQNEIISLKYRSSIVSHDDFIKMGKFLKNEIHQNMIKDEHQDFHREAEEDPESKMVDVIFEETDLEDTIDLNIDVIEKAKKKVKDINKFILKRGVADINQIEGKYFESPNKPKISQTNFDENELYEFREHWEKKAFLDEKRVKNHINSIFYNIVSENNKCIDEISSIFIHNSWLNSYYPQRIEEVSLLEAGKALHQFLIVKEIVKNNFFNYQKRSDYHNKLIYVILYYPYSDILSDLNCNFMLHMGDLPSNFHGDIYHKLIFILLKYIGFENLIKFYDNYLNRTEDLLFDDNESIDCKSALNTLFSKRHLKANYKQADPKGLDHQKVFYIELYCNGKKVASGSGKSKKEAQNDAAFNYFKNKNISFKNLLKKSNRIKQSKYFLDEARISKISPIAKILGIKNLSLLDIALTHKSYLNEHPESRSYNKLAFLGSYLDNFFRISNFIEWTKNKDVNIINSQLRALKHKSPTVHFPDYFNKMHLDRILKVRFQSDRNLSSSIKTDTVQSLVAVTYIDKGFEDAKLFSLKLWENVYKEVEEEPIIDFVTHLQEVVQKSTKSKNGKIIGYQKVLHKQLEGNKNIHKIKCIIEGHEFEIGEGPNKKEARQNSAEKTLKNKTFIDKYLPN